MRTTFDVISDLYLSSANGFTWEGKATSLYCIVAGNIASDYDVLFGILTHIAKFYKSVFFIDGDFEHSRSSNFTDNYEQLIAGIDKIKNVTFLHESIIVMKDVTLIGTNGWTTFNFTNTETIQSNMQLMESNYDTPSAESEEIFQRAISDQRYLLDSVSYCQTDSGIQNIIIITNAVPCRDFISHDMDYSGTLLGDIAGNSGFNKVLVVDTESKVSTWIFGRYSGNVDSYINGVRFTNHPKGHKPLDTYFPKIVKT